MVWQYTRGYTERWSGSVRIGCVVKEYGHERLRPHPCAFCRFQRLVWLDAAREKSACEYRIWTRPVELDARRRCENEACGVLIGGQDGDSSTAVPKTSYQQLINSTAPPTSTPLGGSLVTRLARGHDDRLNRESDIVHKRHGRRCAVQREK